MHGKEIPSITTPGSMVTFFLSLVMAIGEGERGAVAPPPQTSHIEMVASYPSFLVHEPMDTSMGLSLQSNPRLIPIDWQIRPIDNARARTHTLNGCG